MVPHALPVVGTGRVRLHDSVIQVMNIDHGQDATGIAETGSLVATGAHHRLAGGMPGPAEHLPTRLP